MRRAREWMRIGHLACVRGETSERASDGEISHEQPSSRQNRAREQLQPEKKLLSSSSSSSTSSLIGLSSSLSSPFHSRFPPTQNPSLLPSRTPPPPFGPRLAPTPHGTSCRPLSRPLSPATLSHRQSSQMHNISACEVSRTIPRVQCNGCLHLMEKVCHKKEAVGGTCH